MNRTVTAVRGLTTAAIVAAALASAPALAAPASAAADSHHHHPRHHHHRRLTAAERRELHRDHLEHLAHLRHLAYTGRHRRRGHTILQSAPGDPHAIAEAMLGAYGWGSAQMGCLDPLWARESGWNPYAENPSSGAYGIPQSLPGDKMASAGSDWRTDAATQIRWGLFYISERYGSPCAAWNHEAGTGWY